MDELNESYGHFKMAAGHAAGGAAEKVTPTYDRARNGAVRRWESTKGSFEPFYNQVREGAAQARQRSAPKRRNRTPILLGLLAAGAAAGAAGALAIRRRRAVTQWDDLEPLGELDSSYGFEGSTGRASSAKDKVSQGVASVAGGVANQAGKVAESLRSSGAGSAVSDKAERAGSAMADQTKKAGNAMGSMTDRATDSMSDMADDVSDKADSAAERTRHNLS